MSAVERLAGLFVAPAGAGRPGASPALALVEPQEADAPLPRPGAPRLLTGPRVCVLGGGTSSAAFAATLAARLARLPGARCAVLCAGALADSAAAPASPLPPGPTAPVARRAARALTLGGLPAEARGRVVTLALPEAPEAALVVLAAVAAHAPGAPTLTLLPGPRSGATDTVVAGCDMVLAVVPAGAPPAVADLAVGELELVAPGAVVRTVGLPARAGAAIRRRAVRLAVEALR